MALKITTFFFAIFLAFSIAAPSKVKDVPFDVNEVINRVSPHHSRQPNSPSRVSDEGRFDQSLTSDLTGEFLIDTNVVYVPAPDEQESPSVAFDGTNYLVVWYDGRFDSYDIFGARVNQSGVVLDPAGFSICKAANNQRYPSAAFDGTNFFVVWQDGRSGYEYDIYSARVNQDGTVLDTNGIAISTAVNYQGFPSVAFDGTNYLVVWEHERNSSLDIYGTRVSQDGQILEPSGIAISIASDWQEYPAVAFDGTNYLVVWEDRRSGLYSDIYGTRVNQSGMVLDPAGIIISTAENNQGVPSIAFDGVNYLVVWHDYRTGRPRIYGTRVNQSGMILDPTGLGIATTAYDKWYPSVAFDDTNYLVVWEQWRGSTCDIYGTRVSTAGIVLNPAGIAISTASDKQHNPKVAFDGSNYLVLWQDERRGSGEFDTYGTRVDQAGRILDSAGFPISTAANPQYFSAVAFDGLNYLVVWQDNRSGYSYDIYRTRVNQSGIVLDPAGVVISSAENHQKNPAVAFDSTNYLVVWEDLRNDSTYWDIYGARINQAGVVLDTSGIPISIAIYRQLFPAVAFDGTNYLVVWQDYRHSASADIYGARVSQAGIVLDSVGFSIAAASLSQTYPQVAFDGTNYLVVWQDNRNNSNYPNIYGARVSQEGIVLDSAGIVIPTAAYYGLYSPSVAFDGTNYLVVWTDGNIYGARVSQAGTVLDLNGIAISITWGEQELPSVIFDGTNYVVVWQDSRSDSSYDIYGAKVNPSGIVIDSFMVSVQSENQYSPALTKGLGNQYLITYYGWTDSINHHPANTYRIWGKFYPDIVGISEENSKVKMQSAKLLEVYPNPAKTVMRVRCPWPVEEKTDLKIFDVSGKMTKEIASPAPLSKRQFRNNYATSSKKVLGRNDGEVEMKISLKGISPGIYFLRLGKETKKFLVVK